MRRICPLVCLLGLSLFVQTVSARAAVVYVNATASGSPRDGSTWNKGTALIQDAMTIAKPGDEIWVAAGTYTETVAVKSGVALFAGFNGTEAARSQRDWRANTTIIDANLAGSCISIGTDALADTVVDGFTLTNGKAPYGGGVYINKGTPIIRHCLITKCSATDGSWGGGGIFLDSSSAYIINNTIRNNNASLDAGGIYVNGASPVIKNNAISLNTCGRYGGAIRGRVHSGIISNNTIEDNIAYAGDGNAAALWFNEGSWPTVGNNIIAFNSAGIYASSDTSLRFRTNDVYGNSYWDYSTIADMTGFDGNIKVDPLTIPNRRGDRHIQPNSPCRDVGDNSLVAAGDLDIDDQFRNADSMVDIGADESDGSQPAPNVIYVNTAGNDKFSGSSWAQAKRRIQAGVDLAGQTGGEVWVFGDIYQELVSLKPGVQVYGGFSGSETTRDTRDWRLNVTTIDGNFGGSPASASTGTAKDTMLDGFTVTNGKGTQWNNVLTGGGIWLYNSSATIRHNIITGNAATGGNYGGGGLFAYSATPTITNNVIVNNKSDYDGGGIYIYGGYAIVTDNSIALNTAGRWGGGLQSYGSYGWFANNTIVRNYCPGNGGGFEAWAGTLASFVNNIVAYNSTGVRVEGDSSPRLRYNCVYGNAWNDYSGISDPTGLEGNIKADPQVVLDTVGSAHIAPSSPCVNAGDSGAVMPGETDIDGQLRVAGSAVDMGCDESAGAVPAPVVVYVRSDGDDTKDGSSWSNAKKRPQVAIDTVAPTGGEVWVAKGVYTGTIKVPEGVALYGGFTGQETSRDARDWRANVTTLDANQGGSVVTIGSGVAADTIVDGFTVTNGTGTQWDSRLVGGGFFINNGSPTIRHCTIVNNQATGSFYGGGGIFEYGAYATITNNTILRNKADYDGGGIFVQGANPLIKDNTVSLNSAGQWGGGICAYASAAPSIFNNTITQNYAGDGSGIEGRDSSILNVVNNIIAFNSTGVRSDSSAVIFMRFNNVYGNTWADYSNMTNYTGLFGNFSSDPLLTNTTHGDPHISPTSPCRDAGDNSVVIKGDTDVENQPRNPDGKVDIGAYESTGVIATPLIIRVKPTGNDANDGSSWTKAKKRVQAAIDAAASTGGEVWAAKGTFVGTATMAYGVQVYGGFAGTETARDARNWRSNVTTLDANHGGSVVTFPSGTGPDTLLDGFTITNGSGSQFDSRLVGGGVYFYNSDGTVRHCVITGNAVAPNYYGGGGVFIYGSSPTITGCTIRQNTSSFDGGAFYIQAASPRIVDNTISLNTGGSTGGGIFLRGCSGMIANNTITGNNSVGVAAWDGSNPVLVNNIVAFNQAGVRAYNSSDPRLRYNDVYGNTDWDFYGMSMGVPTGREGNVSADPLIVTDPHGDQHIDPASPCIDAGDNSVVMQGDTDIDNQARIRNTRVDIGADESDASIPVPAVVFVKATGDDTNDGLTWATPKKRVQAAIDLATTIGAEVWVGKGTYLGTINMGYSVAVYGGFAGSETLRSQRDFKANATILDGNKGGSVVSFGSGMSSNTILDGFTVQNGTGTQWNNSADLVGGGIYMTASDGIVRNCTITNNNVTTNSHGGGGLFIYNSAPTITDNVIRGNTSTLDGGGIYLYGTNARVASNLILKNAAGPPYNGGGIFCRYSAAPLIVNNTIVGNTSGGSSAVGSWDSSSPSLVNNIIAFNSSGLWASNADLRMRYNDIFGNTAYDFGNFASTVGRDGNIGVDPGFKDRTNDDYRLQPTSLCINAGDNSVVGLTDLDLSGNARRYGADVDMGAYEFNSGYTVVDVLFALRIASGMALATQPQVNYFNIEKSGNSSNKVDILDAIRLCRKALGTDSNP